MKGHLNKKLENPNYQSESKHRQRFFKLEVQILLALEDRGWTYEDLAKVTGIHKQNIWRDLKNGGLHRASLERISRYAEALGLHAYHILLISKQEKKFIPQIEKALLAAQQQQLGPQSSRLFFSLSSFPRKRESSPSLFSTSVTTNCSQ